MVRRRISFKSFQLHRRRDLFLLLPIAVAGGRTECFNFLDANKTQNQSTMLAFFRRADLREAMLVTHEATVSESVSVILLGGM